MLFQGQTEYGARKGERNYMTITASMVKTLRDRTGAGMMDCKRALQETGGDMDRAVDYLREKGIQAAAKRAGRMAKDGLIASYIHPGDKLGVLLELNCETDFVARTEEFRQLAKDIAMQIAAAGPVAVSRDDLPEEFIEKERTIYKAQALNEKKPESVVDRIVEGRLDKFFQEVCLLEQPFVKDQNKAVEERVKEAIARLGENITIKRFVRYRLGEEE